MQCYHKQVESALCLYHQRGQLALAHLAVGEEDKAIKVLRRRKIAFLNFQAADRLHTYLQPDQPVNFFATPAWQKIWQEIGKQEEELSAALMATQQNYERQLLQIKKEQQHLRRYRSRVADQTSFHRSI